MLLQYFQTEALRYLLIACFDENISLFMLLYSWYCGQLKTKYFQKGLYKL